MSAQLFIHTLCSISSYSPNCYRSPTLAPTHSQFLSSKSLLKLKERSFLSSTFRTQKPCSSFKVLAAQSNFLKVLQTAWKVGRDGIEAGTNLVPNSIPRPMARISVTFVALSISLFVLNSFLSTAFFVLATMGLVYFAYIAFNKDQGPGGNGDIASTPPMEDPVEEARKIMEKYK